ncbi:putative cytochrome P450 [Annulohypoxylon moriforme]|nr:putative cytochrome P450 [Annulohypoxylon moriforme]
MAYDPLSNPVVLISIALSTFLIITFLRRPLLPNIPIIGSRNNDWFPLLQARWRNTRDFKKALEHAYVHDRPVLVPVADNGDIVILPSTEIKFIIDQPDSVLNFIQSAFDIHQLDYTFPDRKILRVPIHRKLIGTKLTPQIGNLISDMAEEVAWAFGMQWGGTNAYDGWREVRVFDTMRHIVGCVANRSFDGLPFCRDPELVGNGVKFAIDVLLTSTILKLIWKPLRPLLAPLITIPNRIHTQRFRKILMSEIDRRLHDYDKRQSDPEDNRYLPSYMPNDFLQWLVEQAKASGDPYMWRVETLADRILSLNFAAIATTSFTSTQAVLDLVSSKAEYIDEIRAEIKSVLNAHGGRWNKRALGQLEKLDSAIRESARLNSVLTIGLRRTVVAENGLTTPSGVHLPRGTRVSVSAYNIMRDETIYAESNTFVPFRFYDLRNNNHTATDGFDDRKGDYVQRARNALPTTNPDYLAFGHGKQACPGRFFAAAELKLILAYALLDYDFEMLPQKPEAMWFGSRILPPLEATFKVRKRKEA